MAQLLALVAPPACVACRAALLDAGAMVCPDCLRRLPWLRERRCTRCGLPRHLAAGCPASDSALARTWSPLAYEGVARDLVAALKFRGALPLAGLMAAQLVANLPRDLRARPLAVVAVPAHRGRRRQRGHDPAAALAAGFAARAGLPVTDCLRRTDASAHQMGAARSTRMQPGRIAVQVRGRPPERVLLIDDVHTTGATLEACAVALRRSGARWVAGVAYARAL